MTETERPAPGVEADDDDEGFDLARVKDLLGFALRAPRRRPKLAFFMLFVSLAATIATVMLWPRTYTTEAKILAQRNLVLPALGNPQRSVPREADAPTHNVSDTILKHDNIVALIKQVNLIDRWDAQRPPIMKFKDKVTGFFSDPPSEEDKMRALVGVVEKRITVTSDETTVTIAVEWTNPEMAFELADVVQKNFLDARYDADVNVINDAIAILEGHLKDEQANVDAAVVDMQKAMAADRGNDARNVPAPAPLPTFFAPAPAPQPKPAPTATVDPKLAEQLADKRARIKQIEDARAARLADLNRQLENALVTMAPAHPTVVGIKQRIEEESKDPPELAVLKSEERTLADQIGAATPPAASTTAPAPVAYPPQVTQAIARVPPQKPNEDPAVSLARVKLQNAATKCAELQGRIDSARIEMDIARAAFKYRFSVVHPAEVAKKPKKPNVPVVVLVGLLATALLTFLVAAAADLASGRFVEPWQVERKLGIPLLGEVPPLLPKGPDPS